MILDTIFILVLVAGFVVGWFACKRKMLTNQYRMLERLDQWRKCADLHERVIK
ncbi:TPA: hypothetical protein ACIVOM_003629 [Salmonella enterica subsp. enterica serovar Virchow]